jgi:hypothetical protein
MQHIHCTRRLRLTIKSSYAIIKPLTRHFHKNIEIMATQQPSQTRRFGPIIESNSWALGWDRHEAADRREPMERSYIYRCAQSPSKSRKLYITTKMYRRQIHLESPLLSRQPPQPNRQSDYVFIENNLWESCLATQMRQLTQVGPLASGSLFFINDYTISDLCAITPLTLSPSKTTSQYPNRTGKTFSHILQRTAYIDLTLHATTLPISDANPSIQL